MEEVTAITHGPVAARRPVLRRLFQSLAFSWSAGPAPWRTA